MKISRLEPNSEYYLACRRALEDLLAQPTDKQARPCPGCSVICPICGSSRCTCSCSDACAHAPQQLSSEPVYPIEDGILPLVYAFQCLGVCQPCWSCEGHIDPSGERHKLPRVWFYAQSITYPNLLVEYVTRLHIDRELAYPWRIRVAHWGDPLETAFSIEPDLSADDEIRLDVLRRDVRKIATGLPMGIRRLATSKIARLNAALN